MMTFE
jgi:hypothetical protein